MDLNAVAGETGLKLPNCVLMLGKTLMNLDKVVDVLDPRFDPNAALKRHTAEIFAQQSGRHLSLGRMYQALMESAEFVERLPERLNKVADLVANNKLRSTVEAFDERRLMTGLQKIANRIATGLILAALIIGAFADDAVAVAADGLWLSADRPAVLSVRRDHGLRALVADRLPRRVAGRLSVEGPGLIASRTCGRGRGGRRDKP